MKKTMMAIAAIMLMTAVMIATVRLKMKWLRFLWLLVFLMMSIHPCFAQDVTITISPGWNWISYPKAVEMSLNDAFVGFVPVEGDILKTQMDYSMYLQAVVLVFI